MSTLLIKMEKVNLTRNMCARRNSNFSDFLLWVGNREKLIKEDDMIQIPTKMLIKYKKWRSF